MGAPVTELIRTSVDGGIARITIDRPDAGNSHTEEMRDHLADAFTELSASLEVRAIVLPGAGEKHLCTGAGLGGAQRPRPPRPAVAPERALGYVEPLHRWVRPTRRRVW